MSKERERRGGSKRRREIIRRGGGTAGMHVCKDEDDENTKPQNTNQRRKEL